MQIRWGFKERGGRILFICFFLGILAGTFVGNMGTHSGWPSAEGLGFAGMEAAKERQDWFREFGNLVVQNRPWRREAGSREKFLYLSGRRLREGGLLWLVGLTICAAPCFCALAGYAGFSVSWIITCYTFRLGVLGLPGFLASCFPQWLFYGPAWYVFTYLGLIRPAKVRIIPALLAFALLLFGAAAEAFVNPGILALFL